MSVGNQGIDWAAWISAGATAVGVVIVAVTAWFALDSLRDARRTRHAQLITEISRRWDEPLIIESVKLHSEHATDGIMALNQRLYLPPEHLDDEAAERRKADLDLYHKLCAWPNLIETIGVLQSEHAISPETIYKMWGAEIISAWQGWQQPCKQLRELESDPGVYYYFEAIAQEMLRLQEKAAAKRRADSANAANPCRAAEVEEQADRT